MSRPKKKKSEMKTHIITVRFTDDEYNKILDKADKSNLSVSEFIRTQLDKGKVITKYEVVTEKETKRKLAEEYHKIGINLNQIAHHLNGGDEVTDDLIASIEHYISELRKLRRALK